jgi:hypothetical protein
MARLLLVAVADSGDVGRALGSVDRGDSGKITFSGPPMVQELFDMVARVSGSARQAYANLERDGWSNGKVAFRVEGS